MATCASCGGNGECRHCEGRGKIIGFLSNTTCSRCGGSGTCRVCGGSGKV